MAKTIIFLVKWFLGHFYRHLAIFSGHTGGDAAAAASETKVLLYTGPQFGRVKFMIV